MRKNLSILLNGSHPAYLINLRGPLIKALVTDGWVVHVTSPALDGDTRKKLLDFGAKPHEIALDRRGFGIVADLRYLLALIKLSRKLRPSIVLSYTIKPNIFGSIAARLVGLPSAIMVTGLGFAFMPTKSRLGGIARALMRKLYRLATAGNSLVIFQNEDDRRDFIAAGSLADPGKAKVVAGSGVDTQHFSPLPLPMEPAFLMISRLLGNKGVREYVEASTILRRKGFTSPFRLAGFLDHGADSISQQELNDWVDGGLEFIGKLDDVRPALEHTSVYVLPSYREGTPRTVLEAMATGRAIITTDAPGCRETVVDGHNGLLVPVEDAQALAYAMAELAKAPLTVRAMGMASRSLVEEKYDVTAVNAAIIGYLKEALARTHLA
jgi:glycosyltransferase involved in cell wall biosynthesis